MTRRRLRSLLPLLLTILIAREARPVPPPPATTDPVRDADGGANLRRAAELSTRAVGHIAEGSFAGSVIAALFLKRFVRDAKCFARLDIFGWVPRELAAIIRDVPAELFNTHGFAAGQPDGQPAVATPSP